MRRCTTDRVVPAVTLGLTIGVIPFAAIYVVAHRHVMLSGQVHFIGVGLTALVAALAALALTIAGARRRDGRTVLVGTAFTVMASLLALHGIATPGIQPGSASRSRSGSRLTAGTRSSRVRLVAGAISTVEGQPWSESSAGSKTST